MKQKSSTTSGKGAYGELGIDIDKAAGNKKKKPLSRKEVMIHHECMFLSDTTSFHNMS